MRMGQGKNKNSASNLDRFLLFYLPIPACWDHLTRSLPLFRPSGCTHAVFLAHTQGARLCPSGKFDSLAPALSPFGPTIGCSLTRIRPDARLWLIFPFCPRSARSLLNCKQFSLRALGVLGGQILRVTSSHRQALQGAWGKCRAGCIKGDMSEARVAVTRSGMNSDSIGGGGMALEEEVEALERACGAGFDFNRNDV